jgi:HPt (histidine-containing phosphotransfer) domain-containing protein
VENMRATRQAIDAQDWAAAGALGHKLKSSSRYVGAMQLASLCEALERAGHAGQVATCSQLSAHIRSAFAAVQERMEGALQRWPEASG